MISNRLVPKNDGAGEMCYRGGFFLNPAMRKEGGFCYCIYNFGQKSSIYEVRENN